MVINSPQTGFSRKSQNETTIIQKNPPKLKIKIKGVKVIEKVSNGRPRSVWLQVLM